MLEILVSCVYASEVREPYIVSRAESFSGLPPGSGAFQKEPPLKRAKLLKLIFHT